MEKIDCAVFWFRRDLRLQDNTALYYALTSGFPVLPIFIFDKDMLNPLAREDARVSFIHSLLTNIQVRLSKLNKSLVVRYGYTEETWKILLTTYSIKAVYTNHDYEPYARKRDEHIYHILTSQGIAFHTYKDQVIFEKEEILTGNNKPYTVFTPFSKKWKTSLSPSHITFYDIEPLLTNFVSLESQPIPSLKEMGFSPSPIPIPSAQVDETIIKQYADKRNFPAEKGTTRIGIHLRFGTISIRELVSKVKGLSEVYLNELIWREFYMQIMWNFPHVSESCFRKEYEAIPWNKNEEWFDKWCKGLTGFPIVDAGMRELNQTGYMHNRVRMITASFLVKDLLLDWRLGEAYFAEKLLDFELSSNNGGWQWAAGCGTDAAPYFRIFNPESQQKKFDPKGAYIRRWIPEYGTPAYPNPIVNHKEARVRTLDVFKTALAKAKS